MMRRRYSLEWSSGWSFPIQLLACLSCYVVDSGRAFFLSQNPSPLLTAHKSRAVTTVPDVSPMALQLAEKLSELPPF